MTSVYYMEGTMRIKVLVLVAVLALVVLAVGATVASASGTACPSVPLGCGHWFYECGKWVWVNCPR